MTKQADHPSRRRQCNAMALSLPPVQEKTTGLAMGLVAAWELVSHAEPIVAAKRGIAERILVLFVE